MDGDGAVVVGGEALADLVPGPSGSSKLTPAAARSTLRVQVVDTISAGDAFSGGLLGYWRMRGPGSEALADRSAVATAAGFSCREAALTCA